MKPWKLVILRLALACIFGSVVAWTALSAGQKQAQRSILEYSQRKTKQTLPMVVQAVDAYRRKNHSLPRSLSQLALGANNIDYSDFPDGWGRPFIYTIQGTHYFVASYGRDGKPGGTGWDTDFTSGNPNPTGTDLTFYQLLTDPDTRDIVKSAFITGILAGVLCLVTVRPKTLAWRSALSLAVQVVATLAAATWFAVVITVLHVPSGH